MVHRKKEKILKELEKSFEISIKDIRKIINNFHLEMNSGLAGKSSSLAMIPTYVKLPTGKEKGNFLALDLGGTNFRVLELELKGGSRTTRLQIMKFTIDKSLMTGSGRKLFDFVAGCIGMFLKKEGLGKREKFSLGFTFSFPVDQTGIASGKLLYWTKGFDAGGVIGMDVVRLLDEALARKGISNIKIAALANDTVGTLAAGGYSRMHCDIGVILGTGTNACYPEKISGIKKLNRARWPKNGAMIINTEWGNFDKLKRTAYDRAVDKKSSNPGRQAMEKMVSGMYLGEVAWSIIKDIIGVRRNRGFTTAHMSIIEGDGSNNLKRAESVLKGLGMEKTSLQERHTIRRICQLVTLRAARISAACLAAIITRMDPAVSREHTIAVDGSVYEKHPTFAKEISSCLEEIFGSRCRRINMTLVKDGSGAGVAVIAAVASVHTRHR